MPVEYRNIPRYSIQITENKKTAEISAVFLLDNEYYVLYSIMQREVSMDIQLKRGLLDVCVLTAIKNKDSYGYQIIKDIRPYIDISESTLYPILRRLEVSKMLTVRTEEYNGRLRKYYHITELGIDRINEFKNEWKELTSIYQYVTTEGSPHESE